VAQGARVIMQNDTPLPERILATDQTVAVVSNRHPGYQVFVKPRMSVNEAIRHAMSGSDSVFVGVIEETSAQLVDRGTWIATYSTLRVTEVAKGAEGSRITPGSLVPIAEDGGEMTIKGVRVLAGETSKRTAFEKGRRYLLFLGFDLTHKALVVAGYEVLDDGKLVTMIKAPPHSTWEQALSGQPLEKTLRKVRQAIR
jgi:hypothetical protein